MTGRLDGRIAFVTGAASGLGLAIAERFVTGVVLPVDGGASAGRAAAVSEARLAATRPHLPRPRALVSAP